MSWSGPVYYENTEEIYENVDELINEIDQPEGRVFACKIVEIKDGTVWMPTTTQILLKSNLCPLVTKPLKPSSSALGRSLPL